MDDAIRTDDERIHLYCLPTGRWTYRWMSKDHLRTDLPPYRGWPKKKQALRAAKRSHPEAEVLDYSKLP